MLLSSNGFPEEISITKVTHDIFQIDGPLHSYE